MLSWLRNIFRTAKPAQKQGGFFRARSKFDAASNDHGNRNHWLQADSLSPNAAISADVRQRLRERARYEVANNSVAFGVVGTRTHDLIGSGPRLQICLPEVETATLVGRTSDERAVEVQLARREREALARRVEDEWQRWCRASGLAESLRVMERAKLVDGEAFALVTSNERINHPVKLCLRPFECDRVCDQAANWLADPTSSDGITFDAAGNPVSYTVLRQHPGDAHQTTREADQIPAESIFHLFRADRPGQIRGVSWLTPALNLFAILRRYTLAVLEGAETAANLAVIVEQAESGIIPEDDEDGDGPIMPYTEFDVPRRGAMALPPGAKANQLRSEHATTAYGDFRREVLNELGRCLDMPLNLVQGNSSQYNFSSSRIDHLPYQRKLWTEREQLAIDHLHRLFRLWCDEAVLVGLIPDGLPPVAEWEVEWNWDGFDSSGDPQKEVTAVEKLLALNLTTLAEQCAARGLRWQSVLLQRKREQDFAAEIGLALSEPQSQMVTQATDFSVGTSTEEKPATAEEPPDHDVSGGTNISTSKS